MARNLEADMETLRTVLRHAEKRDFASAAALAEKTLAEGFEHPLLLNVLATRREQEGRLDEALRLLQRAVAIAPEDLGARNALAICLQRVNRPAEALTHIEILLKQHPNLAFLHANKGNALIALGALGNAQRAHLRAVELEPNNLAAIASLASIATHRGEHAEARRWAEQALNLAPGYPDAVLSLAAAELAGGATSTAEKLLHHLIVDHRAGEWDRARASGLLGDVLDVAGRYPAAFDAYAGCNERLQRLHREFAGGTAVSDYARALTAAIGRLGPEAWPKNDASTSAEEPATHVFLIGFPRSGTTLLEVLLDGNPGVVSLEEHELLTEGVLKFMREPVDLKTLANAEAKTLEELRAAYWQGARAAGAQIAGKIFIDKHPLNTLKLPLIAKLFPRAKILFAVRDPRDVVLSCFRRRFKMNPAMYQLLTLQGAASLYDAVMEFAQCARPVLNLDWRVVRYESLMANFDAEIAEICRFLGIEVSANLGDFAERVQAREHATPSTAQLSRGLDRSGIGHWRRYEASLAPVLPTLERWCLEYGYER